MEAKLKVTKYGAEWCHGCKVMDKIMSKVLEDVTLKDRFSYTVVDIESIPQEERDEITTKYGKSIPLLIVSNDTGDTVAFQSGAKSIGVTSAFLSRLG